MILTGKPYEYLKVCIKITNSIYSRFFFNLLEKEDNFFSLLKSSYEKPKVTLHLVASKQNVYFQYVQIIIFQYASKKELENKI